MSSYRIRHIALRVESLPQAARFYGRLFDLERLTGGAATAADEPGTGGPRAEETFGDGCLLGRDGLFLSLRPGTAEPASGGRLGHIGLGVHIDDLEGLVGRASGLGCRVVREGVGQIVVEDVYGICWLVRGEEVGRERPTTDPQRGERG